MAKKDYSTWSKEQLIKRVKELEKRKKYGLVWEEKPEEVVEMCKSKLPILKEVKSKEIITDKNKPVNLLIEGDNYHALTVLNYTHAKKIDVIYIDPPYNTGNGDDFRYNDKIVDKEDPYKHSKWVSFMSIRVKLSKMLLKETGLIFISINDAEVANLRLLCDEIFGEDKFVAQLVWKTRQNVDSRSLTGVSSDHEYILVYRKSNRAKLRGREINKDKYSNPDGDPRGPWMSSPMDGVATKERRPNLHFTIVNPNTGIKYEPSPETGWRFQRSTVEQLIKAGRVIWPKNPRSKPRFKRYLNELKSLYTGFSSIVETDFTSYGTKEVRDLLAREAFKFPKPTTLISRLIEQSPSKDTVILDFFAGSGTTGHAVLELNKGDNGNRQFILCTNNENNICTDVCYPRINKVIEGYKNAKGKTIDGLGGNLKYFKTAFVDAEPTDKNKIKLTQQATEMLCVKEETFEKVLNRKDFMIFKNNNHYTGIILDQLAIPNFKKTIKAIKSKFSVYIFSLSDETFDEEFRDVKQKVKLSPIPEAILRVYRRIFR